MDNSAQADACAMVFILLALPVYHYQKKQFSNFGLRTHVFGLLTKQDTKKPHKNAGFINFA